jgi:signal transduction histidine kinase
MIPADAKLELTEKLLDGDDVSQSAQAGLDWLGHHGGVARAICMATTDDLRHLWGVAAIGVSPSRTGEYVIDTHDHRHPLFAVVSSGQASAFDGEEHNLDTPLGAVPLLAVPIRSADSRDTGGLLLIETGQAKPDRDVLWLARVLGSKFRRLRQRNQATDHGAQRERQLLYSVVNAVTDPILLTDHQGQLILGNSRAEQLLVTHGDESDGRRRALELNNLFFSSALAGAAFDQSGLGAREVVLVDPDDGSDLLFELLSSPVALNRDETALVSVLRNVTDLGRAQQELSANYERLRQTEGQMRAERNWLDLIVDSVVDPIVVNDPRGDILKTNTPAMRLFSTSADSGPTADRIVAANVAQFSTFMSNFLMNGEEARMQAPLALTDPETERDVPVEAVAAMVLSAQNELIGVATVLHDLTDTIMRERLYEELKDASSQLEARVQTATAELARQNELLRSQALELEEASRAKSLFLANISHELRTPLHVILGYTWIMQQPQFGAMSDEQLAVVTKLEANGRRLAALINDVLDISRIEAGSVPVTLSTFTVADMMREALDTLEGLIANAKVGVRQDVSPMLPPITSDMQKVMQIIVNLVTNAMKFTHDGEIVVSAGLAGDRLSLSVRDTGAGIAEADHERIFEAFQQAAGTSARSAGGTGLGLAISRRLARLLGGDIFVQSALGHGSTFTLTLPLTRSES